MASDFPPALAIAGGALSIPLFLWASRGMPLAGESRPGDRPDGRVFHLALAILSIALLWFMPAARDPLSRLEPFASHRALLEWACAAIHVLAVSPLLALLVARSRGATPNYPFGRSLRRFALGLVPLLLLQLCILVGARAIGRPAPPQPILADFQAQSWDVRLAMAALIAGAGPLVEETIFRGALQPAFARIAGPELARLGTAVLFGALHGVYACVPIGLLGYFLARVRDADGRLAPCVGIHAFYNLLMLALYAGLPSVRDLYQSAP